ncbi:MAG: hydroxyacid dehydrogenase [Dehalococcoidia bacterium]|nr:hydroxyacid dehydrogenase [Dehalococcoidia bacterium]
MKILVALPLTDPQLDRVRDAAGDAAVVMTDDLDEQRHEIQDTDVLFGHMTPELLEFAPHVQWVQQTGAGVDGALFPAFVESDIVLTSEKGYVGTHLADHAMALLLSLARGIARSVRERTWDNKMAIRDESWEFSDRTMGIVGLGGTGRAVAQRALGFGMRVVAVDPETVSLPPGVEACWPMDQFHRLLGESDAVVIGAPLTAETRGMFDRAAFRAMRRQAILVNVTRGKIVDEAALLEALNEKLIAGAALDVTPQEPLPADHPLWSMPNVVITPHTAGGSPLRRDRVVDLFCRNVRHLRAGDPLEGVIDKGKGY